MLFYNLSSKNTSKYKSKLLGSLPRVLLIRSKYMSASCCTWMAKKFCELKFFTAVARLADFFISLLRKVKPVEIQQPVKVLLFRVIKPSFRLSIAMTQHWGCIVFEREPFFNCRDLLTGVTGSYPIWHFDGNWLIGFNHAEIFSVRAALQTEQKPAGTKA